MPNDELKGEQTAAPQNDQPKKVNPWVRRRKARQMALQGLYQWGMTGAVPSQITAEFLAEHGLQAADVELFRELLNSVTVHGEAYDEMFSRHLSRPVNKLDLIELMILRMGCHELQNSLDVPYRVVISEAVELAKRFGGTASHKFINGVLDKVAEGTRAEEIKAGITHQ